MKLRPTVISSFIGFYIIISVIYVFCGQIHLDEGAYLYAANAVYRGKVLYRDFFYLQPPLHPFIYGCIQRFLPGLITGRFTSTLLGLLSLLCLVALSKKLSFNKVSTYIFLFLIASNPFQIYFFNITRLYALTSFFLYISLYFLIRNDIPQLKDFIISVFFLSLTVGTRLTLLPIFIVILVYAFYFFKVKKEIFIILIFSFLFILVIFLPFILIAGPSRVGFNLLGMNLTLHQNNLKAVLMHKVRASSLLVRYYYFIFIMFIPLIMEYFSDIKKLLNGNRIPRRRILLWCVVVTTLGIHMLAKIYQVSYQVIIMPLFILLVANFWSSKYASLPIYWKKTLKITFVFACIMNIFSYGTRSLSFINGKPVYFVLKEQIHFIKAHSKPDDKIFSADSSLVPVCAGRDILKGMAGSDLFPDWPTDKCYFFNVVNFDILEEYIKKKIAPVVILGDASFSLSLPRLEPIPSYRKDTFLQLINKYYHRECWYPNLFIKGTKTYYYLRKP